MRIGLVTDAACDLPPAFLEQHAVTVLPVTLRMGDSEYFDTRDQGETLAFFNKVKPESLQAAEAVPPAVEDIRDLFLRRLVIDYDFVFCVTMDTAAGAMFEHATRASYAILSGYKSIRREAGIEGPFALRVVNSRSLFTGQAVVVADLLRRVQEDLGVGELRRHVDQLSHDVHTYVLPSDIAQLRNATGVGRDHHVGLAGYMVANTLNIKPLFCIHDQQVQQVFKAVGFRHGAGKLFELTAAQIRKGLKSPFVCISFGGNPEAVRLLPNFQMVERAAREHEVRLFISVMSASASVNAGRRALSVAFAAEPHAFE